MYRRIISLWVAFILLCSGISAFASVEIPADEYIPVTPIDGTETAVSLDNVEKNGLRNNINDDIEKGGMNVPQTPDVVTIGADGEISVVADHISISVYPPFGMLSFTQDIMAQLDAYSMLSDPISMVEELKNMGVHLYMVDLVSQVEVYVSTDSDIVSTIVNDLDLLSNDEINQLTASVASMEPNAKVYTVTCGDHIYLVFDYRDSGSTTLVYTSIKDNTNIRFQFSYRGSEIGEKEIEDIQYLLSDVQIAAV